ncbi:hypothetical protein DE146DRAFT_251739 [Phaeosphaeria sp. MPI-PUGE-AT-0046c]|nr:hypothetical protein DE146DRAFT_251739 [Phaeosphaeria sp. MPI-PUGE-AT-0046c]
MKALGRCSIICYLCIYFPSPLLSSLLLHNRAATSGSLVYHQEYHPYRPIYFSFNAVQSFDTVPPLTFVLRNNSPSYRYIISLIILRTLHHDTLRHLYWPALYCTRYTLLHTAAKCTLQFQ